MTIFGRTLYLLTQRREFSQYVYPVFEHMMTLNILVVCPHMKHLMNLINADIGLTNHKQYQVLDLSTADAMAVRQAIILVSITEFPGMVVLIPDTKA